jgi:prepilin-type processing-associated H-X9-DG protein
MVVVSGGMCVAHRFPSASVPQPTWAQLATASKGKFNVAMVDGSAEQGTSTPSACVTPSHHHPRGAPRSS